MTTVGFPVRWWEELTQVETTLSPSCLTVPQYNSGGKQPDNVQLYLSEWNPNNATYDTLNSTPTDHDFSHHLITTIAYSPDPGYATSISSDNDLEESTNSKIVYEIVSSGGETLSSPVANSTAFTGTGNGFHFTDNASQVSGVQDEGHFSPQDHSNNYIIIQIEDSNDFHSPGNLSTFPSVLQNSDIQHPQSSSSSSQFQASTEDTNDSFINPDDEVPEEEDIPEDLPDLRFSTIVRGKKEKGRRTFSDNWYHFVRRRVLLLSTIRKMFGVQRDAPISLHCNGRGVRNPLKSNLPATYVPSYRNDFDCCYCDSRFKVRRSLSRHLLTHTTFRQFYCTTCWKGFYDSHDLRRHANLHAEINVFYCEFCEAIYTQNITKEDHLSRIHHLLTDQHKGQIQNTLVCLNQI